MKEFLPCFSATFSSRFVADLLPEVDSFLGPNVDVSELFPIFIGPKVETVELQSTIIARDRYLETGSRGRKSRFTTLRGHKIESWFIRF